MGIDIIRDAPILTGGILCLVLPPYRESEIGQDPDVEISSSTRSFYLEPVYRLVPIFNPFLMAALLVVPLPCSV